MNILMSTGRIMSEKMKDIKIGDVVLVDGCGMYVVDEVSGGRLFSYYLNHKGAAGAWVDISDVVEVWKKSESCKGVKK